MSSELLAFFTDTAPSALLSSPSSSACYLFHRHSLPHLHSAPSYQPGPASFLRKSSRPARCCTPVSRSTSTTPYLRRGQRPLHSPRTSIEHPIGIPLGPWLQGLRRLSGLRWTMCLADQSSQARTQWLALGNRERSRGEMLRGCKWYGTE